MPDDSIDQVYAPLFVHSFWFCYQNHQIHFKHPINCYATNNRDLNKARTAQHMQQNAHTYTTQI